VKGIADVEATYTPGPSVVGLAVRHVVVTAGGKLVMEKAFAEGRSTIHVPLDAGRNEIVLTCADRPSIMKQANGDTRPLILGVQGLRIAGFEADPQ